MKQLPIDAFLSYRFLSELNWSPDGTAAAVVVSQCDPEKQGYTSGLWLYEEGRLRLLADRKGPGGYLWEDSTHILLFEMREGSASGGASTVCVRLNTASGSQTLAFILPFWTTGIMKLRDGVWLAVKAESPEPRPEDAGTDCQVLTEIPFYANGKGFIDGKRLRLCVFDEESENLRTCPEVFTDVRELIVEGGAAYFLGSDQPTMRTMDPRNYYEGGIYRLDWETCHVRCLTSDGRYISNLQKLGEKLVAVAAELVRREIPAEGNFYEVDRATGDFTLLTENDDAIGNSVGTDCRYGKSHTTRAGKDGLYFTKTVRSAVWLCCLRGDGTVTTLLKKEGTVDDFDVSPKGEILLTGMYNGRLQELYLLEDGLRQCSHFNTQVLEDVYVAECRRITVPSRGWDIDGWVLLPKNFDKKRSYPAILNIHGGPRNAYGEVFYHEMQYWANQGYFVFYCNPVGGSGRGLAFADILGRQGEDDYQNIMDFTDAVLKAYPQIDPARLGCTGGSYGGYLSNWILGHTDRFAAIATQRSISNWVSFCGVSDIGFWFPQSQMGADIFTREGVEKLWRHSPLSQASEMNTPTLIIHSTEDYNCPLEQGLQLFTALKTRNVPVRMCVFRGENHELSRSGKPTHRLRRLREITEWMDRYLGIPAEKRIQTETASEAM